MRNGIIKQYHFIVFLLITKIHICQQTEDEARETSFVSSVKFLFLPSLPHDDVSSAFLVKGENLTLLAT